MDASVIHALLTAQPFRPFRLSTRRTGSYVITSPADVLLTRATLYVAQDRGGADNLPASALALPLAQVASADVV
jgi:hypothetical protein